MPSTIYARQPELFVDYKSLDNPLQNKHVIEAKFKHYSDCNKDEWQDAKVNELPSKSERVVDLELQSQEVKKPLNSM